MAYLDDLMSTGETVQHVTRQHWVALLLDAWPAGLATLLLVAVAGWLTGADADLGASAAPLEAAAALVPLARVLRDAARWYVKRYAVSTRRVMEIEGVLNRTVRDSNLDKVNDITLRQSLPGRMLDYGDLEIITGSDAGINRLERIASPVRFKRVMLDNKEDFDTLLRHRVQGSGLPEQPFPDGGS